MVDGLLSDPVVLLLLLKQAAIELDHVGETGPKREFSRESPVISLEKI